MEFNISREFNFFKEGIIFLRKVFLERYEIGIRLSVEE